jgi:hypothetical protein
LITSVNLGTLRTGWNGFHGITKGYSGFGFWSTTPTPTTFRGICRRKNAGNSRTHFCYIIDDIDPCGNIVAAANIDMSLGNEGDWICSDFASPWTAPQGGVPYNALCSEEDGGDSFYWDNTQANGLHNEWVYQGRLSWSTYASPACTTFAGDADNGGGGYNFLYGPVNLVVATGAPTPTPTPTPSPSPTPPPSFTPFDFAINFRASANFVSDPANTTYCLAETYPVTRLGVAFGWISGSRDSRNRSTGVNPALAGFNFVSGQGDFKIGNTAGQSGSIPAGTYEIRLALGETDNPQRAAVQVFDGSTLRFSLSDSGVSASQFMDAMGTMRSTSSWPSTNSPRTIVISSGVLILRVGMAGSGSNYPITHVYLHRVG